MVTSYWTRPLNKSPLRKTWYWILHIQREFCLLPFQPPHSGPGGRRINLWKWAKKRGNNTLNIVFPRTRFFYESLDKNDFWPFLHFLPWKGHFGLLEPKNSPPSSQTTTYWKTEGIQSYLRIWGRHDLLSRTRLSPKNLGYMGVA